MTRPLPFTEASVRRAIAAARKEGLDVGAVSISPDGTVTLYRGGVATTPPPGENPAHSKWLDVEA
jgi:hypothetical protein